MKTIDKGLRRCNTNTWHRDLPTQRPVRSRSRALPTSCAPCFALFVHTGIQHESIALAGHTTFVGIYLNPAFGIKYELKYEPLLPWRRFWMSCAGNSQTVRRIGGDEEVSRLLSVLHDQIMKDNVQTYQCATRRPTLKHIFEALTESQRWTFRWRNGERRVAHRSEPCRVFSKREFNTSCISVMATTNPPDLLVVFVGWRVLNPKVLLTKSVIKTTRLTVSLQGVFWCNRHNSFAF